MQTRIGMTVMAILVVVAIGVFLRQFQFNPAVIAIRPTAQQALFASPNDQTALIDTAGSGMNPMSAPERFGPETLYEKIDGRADLYLASGFVSLATQRFSPQGASGKWVELFVYEMDTPQNAFSVFSMQRRAEAMPSNAAVNAYGTSNALFMAQENYYLELIGTDASGTLRQGMDKLARLFVQSHGGTPKMQAPGADLFPPDGIEPGTLQLIGANAFGYEQLDQIYTAQYRVGGARLTGFVSDRQTAESASALALEYRRTLRNYGAASVEAPLPVEGAAALQVFDTYEIVFSRGRYLAGIHEADSLEAAIVLTERLARHLEEER